MATARLTSVCMELTNPVQGKGNYPCGFLGGISGHKCVLSTHRLHFYHISVFVILTKVVCTIWSGTLDWLVLQLPHTTPSNTVGTVLGSLEQSSLCVSLPGPQVHQSAVLRAWLSCCQPQGRRCLFLMPGNVTMVWDGGRGADILYIRSNKFRLIKLVDHYGSIFLPHVKTPRSQAPPQILLIDLL